METNHLKTLNFKVMQNLEKEELKNRLIKYSEL